MINETPWGMKKLPHLTLSHIDEEKRKEHIKDSRVLVGQIHVPPLRFKVLEKKEVSKIRQFDGQKAANNLV